MFGSFLVDKLVNVKGYISTALSNLGYVTNPIYFTEKSDFERCVPKFAAFTHVSVSSVLKVISVLSYKSCFFDFLPKCLLKEHATFFVPRITHLANLSFG